MQRDPQPVKLHTFAPMYRYSAPQKGRFREHWQWSVEAIGSADPAVDAELIQLYQALLRRLGVEHVELRLNSIGDAACRPAYLARLEAWLDDHEQLLDAEARLKRRTSPLQVFDVKNAALQAALAEAPPDRGRTVRPPAASTWRPYAASSRPTASPYIAGARHRCGGSTTTPAPPSSSSTPSSAPLDLRRRSLRRAGGGDRRPAHPRDRVRGRHRPAGAGRRGRGAGARAGSSGGVLHRRGRRAGGRPGADGGAPRRGRRLRHRLRRPLRPGPVDTGQAQRRWG